ncbi:MAG TPA: winged helix-turn-helix domain-containing protein [Pyrinomonadaceae bacterium]|jgi:DNA-binding winged helix-turn-helix (wHTH) protein/TolB-like protein
MPSQLRQLYEFGPFILDAAERQLLRDGEPVPLTHKAFETLLILVENSGHVVEKEKFFQTIWANAFVEDGSLTVNISLLRKVLGRNEKGQQYIETLPRRGYRFTAGVKVLGNDFAPLQVEEAAGHAALEGGDAATAVPAARQQATANLSGDEPEAREPENATTTGESDKDRQAPVRPEPVAPDRWSSVKRHQRAITFLLGLLVVAFALTAYLIIKRRDTVPAIEPPRTLAILPFVNLKPDSDSDFLSFSLANAVAVKLGNVHTLVVRPSAYVYKYRNQQADPQKAAEELKVNTLLTGSYLKEDDKLYITAQLIDIPSGRMLWQDTISVRYDKLSAVQDQVAHRIIEELALKLTPTEADRLKRDAPNDLLAYEYYLRGVDLYYAENYLKAMQMLRKSVTLDPAYPRAWAQLGSAYAVHGSLNFGGREFYDRAQEAYEQALKLDPGQVEAKAYLADLLVDTNRFEQAVTLMREVISSEPNNALAHWELSYAYRFGGMLEQSIAEGELSRAADPTLELASAPFSAYLYSGQYEKFINSMNQRDDSALLLFYRGLANYYLKRRDLAARDFTRSFELDPSLLASQIGRALLYGLNGQDEEGIKILRRSEEKVEASGVIDGEGIYKLAQAYAVLNDRRAALRLLRRSIAGGFVCYPYLASDPLLESIRPDPEYDELLKMARARHEDFKARFFG